MGNLCIGTPSAAAGSPKATLSVADRTKNPLEQRGNGGGDVTAADTSSGSGDGSTKATATGASKANARGKKKGVDLNANVTFKFEPVGDLSKVLKDPLAAKYLLKYFKTHSSADGGVGYNLTSYWLEVADFKEVWSAHEKSFSSFASAAASAANAAAAAAGSGLPSTPLADKIKAFAEHEQSIYETCV